MIYVSHPYTGNENFNLNESIKICAELARKFPEEVFVNPLAALQHNVIANTSYDNCLDQCIELLSHCFGIIMTGNWKESRGCMVEYNFARDNGTRIYEGIQEYLEVNTT